MERQGVFEVIDEIRTIDSDAEEGDSDFDDEAYDPLWMLFPNRPGADADTTAVRHSSDGDDDTGPSTPSPGSPTPSVDGWSRNLDGYPEQPTVDPEEHLHLPEDCESPIEVFNLIFTKAFFKFLKAETNRYATQEKARVGAAAKEFSMYCLWKPVTVNDIRGFFVILLHMLVVRKPTIADYWSTDSFLDSSFCASIMSRDRFLQILAFLHFSNNEEYIPRGQEGHQPLHKLQSVYDHFSTTYSALYTPMQNICIDEAICPWRGRLIFRVYMKDKPSKWGIKLYELCESSSGYVCRFEIYCGDKNLSNLPTDVCMRLISPYLDRGYVLYTENYYTCPSLSQKLLDHNTMSVGTVRHNRVGMPKDLAAETLQRGEQSFRRKGGMCAVRWVDKKNVNILTTIHNPTATQVVTTRTQTKIKPVCVQDYVQNMSGVDRSDQLVAYHPLHRRTMKWPKKLFMHLVTLGFVQARILFNKKMALLRRKQLTVREYLIKVGNALTDDFHRHKAEALNRSSAPPAATVRVTAPISSTTRLSALHNHLRKTSLAPPLSRSLTDSVNCVPTRQRKFVVPQEKGRLLGVERRHGIGAPYARWPCVSPHVLQIFIRR